MNRTYALLGAGKTGSKVIELITEQEQLIVFNSDNQPNQNRLSEVDAVISFLPGPAFESYMPMLMDSRLPVISGSTGMSWPDNWNQQLQKAGCRWVWAHNFALGMTIIKPLIEALSRASQLYPDARFDIHEIHHIDKKDAPSGTALSWQDWLQQDVSISHERTGDIVGDHELLLSTAYEQISIRHQALDRSIFASGALWATRYLLEHDIPAGLHPLKYLTRHSLQQGGI